MAILSTRCPFDPPAVITQKRCLYLWAEVCVPSEAGSANLIRLVDNGHKHSAVMRYRTDWSGGSWTRFTERIWLQRSLWQQEHLHRSASVLLRLNNRNDSWRFVAGAHLVYYRKRAIRRQMVRHTNGWIIHDFDHRGSCCIDCVTGWDLRVAYKKYL